MLFSDPKWGNGCLAFIGVVATYFLLTAIMRHFAWSIPRPLGSFLGFLLFLGFARFVVNQIFD